MSSAKETTIKNIDGQTVVNIEKPQPYSFLHGIGLVCVNLINPTDVKPTDDKLIESVSKKLNLENPIDKSN